MSRRRPGRRLRTGSSSPLTAPLDGSQRLEHHGDGAWYVRAVTGAAATKAYRCPGCQQLIVPATPHVVAWPQVPTEPGASDGLGERRHWHTACWRARNRRR